MAIRKAIPLHHSHLFPIIQHHQTSVADHVMTLAEAQSTICWGQPKVNFSMVEVRPISYKLNQLSSRRPNSGVFRFLRRAARCRQHLRLRSLLDDLPYQILLQSLTVVGATLFLVTPGPELQLRSPRRSRLWQASRGLSGETARSSRL